MALAALIAAYHETGTDGALRATLPLAGRTLIERQARLAAAVGAKPIVVLVERIPTELSAAVDRLRGEGVSTIIARNAAEAAAAIGGEDRLLLVADGMVADPAHFERIAGASESALLTVPDDGVDDRHERIDAHSRWAGLALIDGALLRDTAAMLQDWDLPSTLLRRAIQGGARHFAVKGEADGFLLVADSASELVSAEEEIVAGAGAPGRGWAARFLLAPIERLLTRLLMPSVVGSEWLYFAAAALTGVSALLMARGWLWTGGILLLLTTPLDGTAERLAQVRLQERRAPGWWSHVIPVAASAALLALGWSLSTAQGWGCIVLVVAVILFLLALKGELRGKDLPAREWLAERKGMSWLMLPFGATGLWVPGLGVLAAYAAGSFFWAQREAHRLPPPVTEDNESLTLERL